MLVLWILRLLGWRFVETHEEVKTEDGRVIMVTQQTFERV